MSTKKKWHGCAGAGCPKHDACARHLLKDAADSVVDDLCAVAEQLGDPPYSQFEAYTEHPVQRIIPQAEWAGRPIAARSSASIFWMAAA